MRIDDPRGSPLMVTFAARDVVAATVLFHRCLTVGATLRVLKHPAMCAHMHIWACIGA